MNWMQRLIKKRQLENELERELRDHLERQVSDYRRQGLSEEEARRKAALTFGGTEQVREECRDARGARWIESTMQDLRLAMRSLRKSPGFTFTAIATLALGIGANSAIFALLDAVRLRSLPVPNPQQLALIQIEGGNNFGRRQGDQDLSYPIWEQIRDHHNGFSGAFAWAAGNRFELGQGAKRRTVEGLWVSGGMFSTLGIHPVQGSLFSLEDDRTGCEAPRAVISYGFWQSNFGGRASAIGSQLLILDHPTEIIGITPPTFAGLDVGKTFAIALPLCSLPLYAHDAAALNHSDDAFITVMGRLRPGWTLAQAGSQLSSISPAIFQATVPTGYEGSRSGYLKSRLTAYPAANGVSGLRETYETSLWLLLSITGLVLLIACANLANLMLARAMTREREMAVRLAIGASRWRLIRQLLTEGFVLAAAGAFAGVWLARVLSRGIVLFLTTQRDSIVLDLSPNWRIFAFTASAACLSCLIFGLIPAFRGSQTDPGEAIKSGNRSVTANRRRNSLQGVLVVSQIAISLVLLIAATLFVRSFWNLTTLNPGFRERGVVLASLNLTRLPTLPEDRAALYVHNLMTQLRALPQVESAGTTTHVPLDGSSWTLGFELSSQKEASKFTWVSPGYFETLGKPILQGRNLNDHDLPASPRVAVVNQTFVRKFLNGANPLGRTFRTLAEPNYPAREYQIVGVVKDAKYSDLRDEIPPEVFGSVDQFGVSAWPNVFFRSSAPPDRVIAAVRQKLSEISPEIRSDFRVLHTEIQDGLVRERLMAMLSGIFGALAALLAAVGLYGVVSYNVAARRNEIGIRMALGATRAGVVGAILGRAAVLLFSGTVLGLLLAAAAVSTARSLLFGVTSYDPLTFVAAALFLLTVAFAASFIPARRASQLDPLEALRYE
jgi:predicted permease